MPDKNTGVIILPPTKERATSGIPTVFNYLSDWRKYEPAGEWQKDMTANFDTEACMSFAANDTLETYINWLNANGYLNAAQEAFLKDNGYFDATGSVNFSDRFTAKMSGTTANGNDFESVWNWLQNGGAVPESDWPFPMDEINANPSQGWNIYYEAPPDALVQKAKTFLQFFEVDWHWLVSNGQGSTTALFTAWLETAPIHLAVAVCPPWNTASPIQGCGSGAQHGIMLSDMDTDGTAHILDHYVPFDKTFAPGYTLSYAVQGWVNQIPQTDVNANLTQQISLAQKVISLLKILVARKSTPAPVQPPKGATMGSYQSPDPMSTTSLANLVAFLSGFLTLIGVSTVTGADISSFVKVLLAIVDLIAIAWAHFAHRAQVQALSAGAVNS